MKMKVTKNIPALIATTLAAVAGLSNLFFISRVFGLDFFIQYQSYGMLMPIVGWKITPVVASILGLIILVLAFVRFNKVLNAVLIFIGFIAVDVVSNLYLIELVKGGFFGMPSEISFFEAFWYTGSVEDTVISLANILWLLALIAACISLVTKQQSEGQVAPSSAPEGENRFDPETGLPLAGAQAPQPVANGGAESSLPLVALILAFFVPLGAVIVGHIAMNQMNQGQISSQNRGMAKAGLVLGYVFMGLSVLFGVIFGIAYFALLSNSYY